MLSIGMFLTGGAWLGTYLQLNQLDIGKQNNYFFHHPFGTVTGLMGPDFRTAESGFFIYCQNFEVIMERVIAFVDAFNLYHSLDDNKGYHKYKWLNIKDLLGVFVPPKELKEVYYFTALTTWNTDKVSRRWDCVKPRHAARGDQRSTSHLRPRLDKEIRSNTAQPTLPCSVPARTPAAHAP